MVSASVCRFASGFLLVLLIVRVMDNDYEQKVDGIRKIDGGSCCCHYAVNNHFDWLPISAIYSVSIDRVFYRLKTFSSRSTKKIKLLILFRRLANSSKKIGMIQQKMLFMSLRLKSMTFRMGWLKLTTTSTAWKIRSPECVQPDCQNGVANVASYNFLSSIHQPFRSPKCKRCWRHHIHPPQVWSSRRKGIRTSTSLQVTKHQMEKLLSTHCWRQRQNWTFVLTTRVHALKPQRRSMCRITHIIYYLIADVNPNQVLQLY